MSATSYEIRDVGKEQSIAYLDVSSDVMGQPLSQPSFLTHCLAFSHDNRYVAFTRSDGLLQLFDLEEANASTRPSLSVQGGREIISFDEDISDAVVLPEGQVAATGTDNYSQSFVRVRNASGQVESFRTGLDTGEIRTLGASPDGKILAGSAQWGIWQLDIAKRQVYESPSSVTSDGSLLQASHVTGRPIWPQGTDKPLSILPPPDFRQGPLHLTTWDAQSVQKSTTFLLAREMQQRKGRYQLEFMISSPDGLKMVLLWNQLQPQMQNGKRVISVAMMGLIEVRDTSTGRLLRTLETPDRRGAWGALGRPAWSSDASRLAIPDGQGRVFLWDTSSGKRIGQLSGTRLDTSSIVSAFASELGHYATLAFTPDHHFLAAGRDDGSIYLYSLQSFLPVAQIGKAHAQLRWMQFSPDGCTLYGVPRAGYGKSVLSWQVPNLGSQ